MVYQQDKQLQNQYAGDLTSTQAWNILQEEPKSYLIDVRTQSEWDNVGYPDLSTIGKNVIKLSWRIHPSMQINPDFINELSSLIGDKDTQLIFICKSGGRSLEAAMTMTHVGYKKCYNLINGFEGYGDNESAKGWKANNLPWRSS